MNRLQRLKNWWYKSVEDDSVIIPHDDVKPYPAVIEVDAETGNFKLRAVNKQSKGRVIATKHSVYQAGTQRTGGRVVKIMPKQLKQMKQAQEKVEDD